MIAVVVRALLAPALRLAERYLENQSDRDRLRAASDQVAYRADQKFRGVKVAHWMGRLPLFAAECAAASYFIAILVDSTYPLAWLAPLELPEWFKPHFYVALASIFGIATVDRWLRR